MCKVSHNAMCETSPKAPPSDTECDGSSCLGDQGPIPAVALNCGIPVAAASKTSVRLEFQHGLSPRFAG
jgi:hypothetical protein